MYREREEYFPVPHVGARRYARFANVIAASGYASGMNRVCVGYDSGMHRGTHQVITLSVKTR